MQNKIKELKPYSFIDNRDFFWVAEYLNGTLLPEFNLENGQKNDFYDINKNILMNFGYLGCGVRFFFDTVTGIFNICDNEYSFEYITDGKTYNLTNQMNRYNDIISYKSMFSDAQWGGIGIGYSSVSEYHFGYKINFQVDDINFHFKPIMHIPLEKPAYFTLRIVSSKNLEGRIIIKKNGLIIEEIKALLDANVGGELTWMISL